MQHVIIGAGPAGIIAAETLRKLDSSATIAVIGNEPEPPYSRMALPYYLVNDIDERGTYLRKSQDHYDKRKIDLIQDNVLQVNSGEKSLRFEKGAEIHYDKLLIASGASPITPPIPGIDLAGVHTCWTLADARRIEHLASAGAKVVLIGAGFIGCILLESLVKRGVELVVVEAENRMVPRMMNDASGTLIKQWCQQKGISVMTSTQVSAIEQANGSAPLAVQLDNGQVLPANLVISATGVRSNVAFLQNTGISTDQGILVDEQLQTSEAGVFAAGDVAQGKDFCSGEYSVQAIQPTAAEHGRIAAQNMAGQSVKHRGSVNMNVLSTLGLISSSFGLWMGVVAGDSVELNAPDRYRYLNLQFEDDRIVGASSLGFTQHVGVVRGLIQSRVRLGLWKDKLKKDPTRVMEAYLANIQALGHNASVV